MESTIERPVLRTGVTPALCRFRITPNEACGPLAGEACGSAKKAF